MQKPANQGPEGLHFKTEKLTSWIGSISSLIIHTVCFTLALTLGFFSLVSWDMVLLILTTAVSLEAIYLAIFIQMTVNRNTESLKEVEEDIEDIEEDIEEIQEDLGEIEEDEEKDQARKARQSATLEKITVDLQKLVNDIESLKKIQR